jgi:peptidoglycan/LPS O-acetylase OafA/YrhL
MQTKNLKLIFPAAVVMILLTFAAAFKINPILAETGKGKDIFKVITTIRMLFSNYVI